MSSTQPLLASSEFVDFFVKTNKCSPAAPPTRIADGAMDGTTIDISTYSGGKADVVFYQINGGGHTWPGGNAQPERVGEIELGKTTHNISATQIIWNFFKKL